jgi:acetyl-CoA carboxylase biotin carboxyl carrier protein
LTFEQIKELATLVAERGLESLELERGGFSLRIASPTRQAVVGTAPPSATAHTREPIPPAPIPPAAAEDDPHAGAHLLTSPIVGTFYVAPSPDADAFVRVGDRVKKGQIVCIVEAMKLMNEIEADVDGIVVEVIPQNAQPVEYGEPLFAIRQG